MIDTAISGVAGSDCVASSPGEAVSLALAWSAANWADISPAGSAAGDELLPPSSAYTPE